MHIASAIFQCSAPDLASCPDESLPEFAFIGRSNVGKSSLLNMLAGKEALARVSPRPGFTRLINIFKINKTWRLVDLPGYGFAEGARRDKVQFNRQVRGYLQHRPNLSCVFVLLDSGLPPQKMDLDFVDWLTRHGVPYVLVFTKIDQGKPEEVQANITAFKESIAGWFTKLPEVFQCSSVTGQGRSDLLKVISETLEACQAEPEETEPSPPAPEVPEEVEPPFSLRVRAGSARDKSQQTRKKSKSARPW